MTTPSPELSIIMPVYNEQAYISHAIESILQQNTDFIYEIVIVDDCSTDGTAALVSDYAEQHPDIIRMIRNDQNRGNAHSFWNGLSHARGDYFQVLDGDDFFIRADKLQMQVDFLRQNPDFSSVATNSLRLLKDKTFFYEIAEGKGNRRFSYDDILRCRVYFHTSTYMFRNIYKDRVPDYLKEEWARGDYIRTLIHAMHGPVQYLDVVTSVYRYNNKGIWSSMSAEEKRNRTVRVFQTIRDTVLTSERDKSIFDETITFYARRPYFDGTKTLKVRLKMLALTFLKAPRQSMAKLFSMGGFMKLKDLVMGAPPQKGANKIFSPATSLQALYKRLSDISYSPEHRKKAFSNCFTSRCEDQMCEAIGRMYLDDIDFLVAEREYNDNKIVILVSGLQSKSGGVLREIMELIDIHRDQGHEIVVICTEIVPTSKDFFEKIPGFASEGIHFITLKSSSSLYERLQQLAIHLIDEKPGRLYPFPSHNDVIMSAILQHGLAKEIVLSFCLDHGVSNLITNSAIDKIIVKRPYQYFMLEKIIDRKRLVYIPYFMKTKIAAPAFQTREPFSLNTATGCARSYKIQDYKYDYAEVIAQVLSLTNGKHYHFGPLDQPILDKIQSHLDQLGISGSNFVHIPWAPDLSAAIQEHGINLYIQSFPVGSSRISIEVMQCGIPVINHLNEDSPIFCAADYCHDKTPVWSKPEDLYRFIRALDRAQWEELARDARHYYDTHNTAEIGNRAIISLQGMEPRALPYAEKITLPDIAEAFPKALAFQSTRQYKIKQKAKAVLQKARLMPLAHRLHALLPKKRRRRPLRSINWVNLGKSRLKPILVKAGLMPMADKIKRRLKN